MRMVRVLITLPVPLKAKLDALRREGYTASGFIRSLLETHFTPAPAKGQKGR